jgi:predicted AAA+ superfamily ATPase
MMTTYTRHLALPRRSFFLFGPRGTGKTTWLRQELPEARWYDLVRDREVLRLTRDAERFSQEVQALPRGAWVVVDEVQRLPALLNDVQDLIARTGHRVRFALTSSSARKLRREQANLLAMRLVNRQFFPLTAAELGADFSVENALRFGTLPAVAAARTHAERVDLLEAYVTNYLAQEIRAEALVRRLDAFTRFLDVAALANGQVTNLAGLARDAAVARPTVQGYFETLTDTLIGTFLPAWRARAKVKEIAHPKFFFFDPGVVRARSSTCPARAASSATGARPPARRSTSCGRAAAAPWASKSRPRSVGAPGMAALCRRWSRVVSCAVPSASTSAVRPCAWIASTSSRCGCSWSA